MAFTVSDVEQSDTHVFTIGDVSPPSAANVFSLQSNTGKLMLNDQATLDYEVTISNQESDDEGVATTSYGLPAITSLSQINIASNTF